MSSKGDKQLEEKCKRCCDGMNKTLHTITNNPSLGLFRIQQNIHKMLPIVSHTHTNIKKQNDDLKVVYYKFLNYMYMPIIKTTN